MIIRSVLFSAYVLFFAGASVAAAQGMAMPMPEMMAMPENPLGIDHVREGSGTSWQPDASPMQGGMRQRGAWMLMWHGQAFLEFTKTGGGDRGRDQFGSVNWVMGMAQRPIAGGQLQVRTMFSVEPLTVGKCGYPALLQSGEFCDGIALFDRQHPHDLFMEVAADFRRAINDSVAFELYGGPAAEPALGPTAFAHRLSAWADAIAPISHHWLDSTHVSFGVVTGGVYGKKWKAEASLFNGREPDDRRYDFDLAAFDSYSGRAWWLPAPEWAIQVSAGHLKEAEFRVGEPRADVDRLTASATYHRLVNSRLWATTIAWGQNREHGHSASAFSAETAADLTRDDTVFARVEVVGKTASELVLPLPGDDPYTVTKLHGGYTRWAASARGPLQTGLGASVGLSFVPAELAPYYGGRAAGEFTLFLVVRPR